MRVALDAGHGGSDPGAVGHGLHEADITLQVARLLKKELTAAGHEVMMTRERQNQYVSLDGRANRANTWGADIFVSLHCNAAARPEVEGMEIFSFPGSDESYARSIALFGALGANGFVGNDGPHKWRGCKEANFAVLRLTSMPAVLVEMEFTTNERQARNLADPAWQLRMAKALAEGIGA